MLKEYHTVAFDLDGTLSDPSGGLIESFAYGLSKSGIGFGSKEELRRYIGPPLYDAWKTDFRLTEEEADRALARFTEYYQVYGWWDNKVYPGIPELLADLHRAGKRVCLATSKPAVFTRKVLDLFGIRGYFDAIGAAVSDKTHDKKSEVLLDALEELGVRGEEALRGVVLVGDRKFDAEGARQIGVDAIGVSYGLGSREELEASGFCAIADSVAGLRALLLNNE